MICDVSANIAICFRSLFHSGLSIQSKGFKAYLLIWSLHCPIRLSKNLCKHMSWILFLKVMEDCNHQVLYSANQWSQIPFLHDTWNRSSSMCNQSTESSGYIRYIRWWNQLKSQPKWDPWPSKWFLLSDDSRNLIEWTLIAPTHCVSTNAHTHRPCLQIDNQ